MPVELGHLKEFITPAYYSWFSYAVVGLYLLTGAVFLPLAFALGYVEENKFRCDFSPDNPSGTNTDQVTSDCYKKYDERYNSPLPLHGILFLSLASVVGVCSIYYCFMRSRTRPSRVAPTNNAENANLVTDTTHMRHRRVYCFYLLHLVIRLGLMILITALSFYRLPEFPDEFDCVPPGKQQRNNTHFNETSTLKCRSSVSVARDKTNASRFTWVVNIIYLFFVFGEIVYLVWRASRRSDFTVDSNFCAEHFANQTCTVGYREQLKQTTLKKTEKVEQLKPCEEERTIDDMFVDLELHSRLEDITLDDYEELFLPKENTGDVPKTLIIGPAGTGKSLLCQKLLREWSKKSRNTFDFAFLFKFRSYNKEFENISLRQLLNPAPQVQSELENVIQELLNNPEKILIIFDGLDEFQDHVRCRRNEDAFENKAEEKMPVWALYTKLLQDKLLPGATVLTTSRPDVIPRIEMSLFDRTVDIKEFTEKKVHEYVDRYYKRHPDQVAVRIKEHINSNSHLLSLCFIPLYCHILCYQLMKEVKREGNPESATSLQTRNTDIYKRILAIAVSRHHHRDRSSEVGAESSSNSIEALKQLARLGIRENRTAFSSEEVRDVTERNFGLLKQTSDENENRRFCFTHQVFQDFLAAKAIVNSESLEENINEVITGLKSGHAKWYGHVIQFVAGLLDHDRTEHKEVVESLITCLKESLLSNPSKGEMALLMMKCLYEYNDDNVAKAAMSEIQANDAFTNKINLKRCKVGPVDCKAIVYVLKHLQSEYSVDLSDNSIGELGCKELAKLVESGGPKRLDLSNNKISDQALAVLTEATTSEQSKIKHLCVTFDKPTRP